MSETTNTLFELVRSTEWGHKGELTFIPVTDEQSSSTLDIRKGRVRRDDTDTARQGATSIAYRAGSQKARLLAMYVQHPGGLTDEEAAEAAGLNMRNCFWKRCSELRQDGYITETNTTREGLAGVQRIVCTITPTGLAAHERTSTNG